MVTIAGPVAQGFVACSPEAIFPGAGGDAVLDTAVREGDLVIGGIAASGAAVSPFYPPGTDPMDMIADGVPANPEDLVVHYALGIPYAGQHGDDEQRWRDAFGELARASWPGGRDGTTAAGRARPSPSTGGRWRWPTRSWRRRSGAVSGWPWPSPTTAGTRSSRTGCRTRPPPPWPWPRRWRRPPRRSSAAALSWPRLSRRAGGQLGALLPFPVLAAPGGLPVEEDGRVVAGLGVAGRDPGACEEIAAAVLAARRAG